MLLKRSLSVHLPRYDTAKVKARKSRKCKESGRLDSTPGGNFVKAQNAASL